MDDEDWPVTGRLGWRELLRVHRAELASDLSNWLWVGMVAAITFPSRIPPRKGLFGRQWGGLPVTLRLRNGFLLRCRLDELEGYYAAFVKHEYEDAVSDWASVESVIDVGANVGAATLWFAREAPAARIVAVEPSPDVFPRLLANIRRSHLEGRVTPVAAAIGAAAGVATVMTESWSVATSTRPGIGTGLPIVGQVSLSQLVDGFGLDGTAVLKLDCEGAEFDTLLSASHDVLRHFQAIVSEYHDVPGHAVSELQEHLAGAGFAVRLSSKGGQSGILVAAREGN